MLTSLLTMQPSTYRERLLAPARRAAQGGGKGGASSSGSTPTSR
ncbi:hypothetical protein [Nonomuraea dietziae]